MTVGNLPVATGVQAAVPWLGPAPPRPLAFALAPSPDAAWVRAAWGALTFIGGYGDPRSGRGWRLFANAARDGVLLVTGPGYSLAELDRVRAYALAVLFPPPGAGP